MLNRLNKCYNYYISPDTEISETEDSFAMFADFEGVSGATVITISIICFLHIRYPILSGGLSIITNFAAGLPTLIEFFVICLGMMFGFFSVTVLLFMLLHVYVRFIYWFFLGFFKKFEKSYHWRQHLDYQLVGWAKTANSLFGKENTWQNYEIIFELHSHESKAYLEVIFKKYFQKLHKKYYKTGDDETRKAWEFNVNTGIMSGSLNVEQLNVVHKLLKYNLSKSNIEVKRVVFISKDEPYIVHRYVSNEAGG